MENLNSQNNRTAVILCGGKGTRLGDIGKKIPKTLVKIQGKEILWFIISSLLKNNFQNIILPLGYKSEKIKKFIKKQFKKKINNIKLVNTGTNTNIGKRISLILPHIKSDNFVLMNGDAIFNLNLKSILSKHIKDRSFVTFLIGTITNPYGTIGVKKNKVIDFKRNLVYESINVRNYSNYKAYSYSGISILNTNFLKQKKKIISKSKNFEQDLYPLIIKKNKVNLFKIRSIWHSVDNIKDIISVNSNKQDKQKYLKLKKLKKNLKEHEY